MRNYFRQALDSIHATEQMKQNICGFLRDTLVKRQRKRRFPLRCAATCCAVLAVVLCGFGGYRFFLTPVSYISVDINPSLELGLNHLDRVVSTTAYNDDGAVILQSLNLKNKTYVEAIELLLADDTFFNYLTEGVSFTVVSDKEEELLNGIQQCHGYAQANAECHSGNAQLVEDAHYNGISFGKYQAFLALSQYDKTITVEECKNLSMRQIRDLISQYQLITDTPTNGEAVNGQGNGHHGGSKQGNGHGGYGYRGGRKEPGE